MSLQIKDMRTGVVSYTDPEKQKTSLRAEEYYNWLLERSEDIEAIREARILLLKDECTKAIYAGFKSATMKKSFGLNELDQINFTQRLTTIAVGATGPFEWKVQSGEVIEMTKEQFVAVVNEAEAHKLMNQKKYWDLEKTIMSARLKKTIDAVKW